MEGLKKGDRILISGSRVVTIHVIYGDMLTCYDAGAFSDNEVVPLFIIKKSSIQGYL